MTSSTPSSSNTEFPGSGRIAAVDFGTVRIGIAICDPDWILASPLEVFAAGPNDDRDDYFRDLARREHIAGFVVGLPIHCDGGESKKSLECRTFARWLSETTNLPVRLFDERFTTADAKRRIQPGGYTRKKEKRRIDAVAALVLLESFLEASRYKQQVPGYPVDASPSGGDSLES